MRLAGNPLGSGPPHLIARELREQADMKVRGERLRAAKLIADANTVDGVTLIPHAASFSWTRDVEHIR